MRFFAHDGKTTHGPAGIDELLKLPGFDGDTLVCPVGSDDSADWKPALAYPPFKKALLEAVAATPAASALSPMEALKPSLPPMPSLSPLASQMPVLSSFPAPLPLPPVALKPVELPKPAPVKTTPCPSCAHANLVDARFCNSCGARMDGRIEEIEPKPEPVIFDSPKAESVPFDSPKGNLPADDAFAHLDPMRSFPVEQPLPSPESTRRPLQPGKMGQLGAYEEPVPVTSYSSPALAPEPAAAVMAIPVWKRPAVIATFMGAAVISAGLAYMMLNKSAPPETLAELTPSASTPMPEPAPTEPPKTNQLYSTPPATSSPAIPAPRAARTKKIPKLSAPISSMPPLSAAKPKRTRKPRPARAAKPEPVITENSVGGETLIESRTDEPKPKAKRKRAAAVDQGDKDPLLEALLSEATQPAAEPGAQSAAEPLEDSGPVIGQRPAAKPGRFSLPGLERPVSASDRAPAPQADLPRPAAATEDAQTPIAGLDDPALAEPGKSSPPPGIEDMPAKSAEGDQLALVQVHEQFDFCAQLLAQGAYGDHYDTCLCKDAREAAPFRGRRGFYVTSRKKEANAGHLETTAKILSSKIDAGVAKVTARWKSGEADKGRTSSQSWKLEDGLWCQAP